VTDTPWGALPGFIAFAVFWVLVISVLTKISGWPELAKLYARPRDAHPSSRTYFQGMVVRPPGISYQGIVNIGASERGLFLFVVPPFQFGLPGLMIPWEDLRPLGRERYWLGQYDWYEVSRTTKRIGIPSWSWGARVVRGFAPAPNAPISP
jgi:hypothetical protein